MRRLFKALVLSLTVTLASVTGAHAAGSVFIPSGALGKPNGPAQLDANGAFSSKVNTPSLQSYWSYTGLDGTSNVVLPGTQFNNTNSSYITLGDETIALGGFPTSLGDQSPVNVTIVGNPWGNYNRGCVLCVFNTNNTFGGGGAQAALSGTDFRSGAYAVANGDLATATYYQFTDNTQVRDSLAVVAYTQVSATLSKPLTINQMARMHPGEYITTNSLDPACTVGPDSYGIPLDCRMRGYLKSFDATHLYVYGWARMGGSAAGGQVPSTALKNLDTTFTTMQTPMVFVGGGGKVFAGNTYFHIDANAVYSGTNNPTATTNSYEQTEEDYRIANASSSKPITLRGHTFSYECDNCSGNWAGANDYAYLVNGPGLPKAFIAQLYGNGLEYSGYNTYLPSNGAPSETVGSNHIMMLFRSHLPTNNTMNFSAQAVRDSAGDGSWANFGVRLGLNLDGQPGAYPNLDVFNGGVDMGDILFNGKAGAGTVCFETGSRVITACSNNDSTFYIKSLTADRINDNGSIRSSDFLLGASAPNGVDGNTNFGGQGSYWGWNKSGNDAAAWFVNTVPNSGYNQGFKFVVETSGDNTAWGSLVPSFTIDKYGVTSNVDFTENGSFHLTGNRTIFFASASNPNAVYLSGTDDGNLYVGTGVNNGANILGVNTLSASSVTLNAHPKSWINAQTAVANSAQLFYCTDCGLSSDGKTAVPALVQRTGTTITTVGSGSSGNGNGGSSTVADGISAAGSDRGGATTLSAGVNVVTTVGAKQGVLLSSTTPIGSTVTIMNRGSNDLFIYPSSTGDQIESYGVGTAFQLAANATVILYRTTSSEWRIK